MIAKTKILRAVNDFPDDLKKKLANPKRSWTLEKGKDNSSWILYEKTNGAKVNPISLQGRKDIKKQH